MEWAPIEPQPKSPVGPTLDMVLIRGLNWTWVSGLFTGYGVGPTWGQLASPVGPHVEFRRDTWAKLGLGFWVVCWVSSGPQLRPSQQAQLAPRWICC